MHMAALKPFVDKLESELTCSVCQDIFKEPKTLPCLHSYCTKCTVQWYERSGNRLTHRFSCSLCKARIDVPDSDATKLRSSFYIDSLLQLLKTMKTKTNQQGLPDCASCEKPVVMVAFCSQCNGLICDDCVNAHKAIKQVRDEHHVTMLNDFNQENVDSFIQSQMLCKEKFHEKNKLEYYCQEETCRRCICQKCAFLYHQNHRMQSLEEAAEEAKRFIQQDMNRANQLKEKYEGELEQSKKNKERIKNEIDLAIKEVDDKVEMICQMAREQGRVIKKSLNSTLHEQTKTNDEEQADIRIGIEHLAEFQLHCETLFERSLYEIIESEQLLHQACEIFFKTSSILCSRPIQRDMIVHFVPTNKQAMQSIQSIGKIVKIVTDPSRSTIELLKSVRCGFLNEFNIVTRNAEGEVCHLRIESIDVKIKDVEGNEVEKKVFGEQNGKYRVSYKPEKAGAYEVQVNIGGEPIKNSPQSVHMLNLEAEFQCVKIFGRRNEDGKGVLDKPKSIALNDNGEIAIVGRKDHRIQIFSLDGKYLRELDGSAGTGEGQLHNPFGVIFYEDGILVSDRPDNKGRIQEFDFNGTYVRTIYRPKQWFAPLGICVNDDKNIAVCCKGNVELGFKPSIKLLSKQGDIIKEFEGINNVEQPRYIAYGNGKYFVSFSNKNYISVFDGDGVLLYKIGEHGKVDHVDGVAGLAVYGPDGILVCDYSNNCVKLFSQSGIFLHSFGHFGPGFCQMVCPTDLAVSADGQVFVLECMSYRVQIWC